MNPDVDQLIAQWKDETLPSAIKLDQIRSEAKKETELTVNWWKSVLSIPEISFVTKAA